MTTFPIPIRNRRIITTGRILLLSVGLLLGGCKTHYEQEAAQPAAKDIPVPVRTQTVERSIDPLPIHASGFLASATESKLAFKVGGIIAVIAVAEGNRIRAGQELARLEQDEIAARVTQAAENVARLQRDLKRTENLYRDSVATLEQLQNLRTALEVADSDLRIARYNQRHSVIRAPFTGRVLRKLASEEEIIGPGIPVLMVGASGGNAYVLKVSVADRHIVRITNGDSAQVTFDPFPDTVFPAIVTEVAQQADPRSGTFEVELALAGGDYPLKNGFIGRAKIIPSRRREYYRIPVDALLEGHADTALIYLADRENGLAVETPIRVVHIGNHYVLVDPATITINLPVIIAGQDQLYENKRITIVE